MLFRSDDSLVQSLARIIALYPRDAYLYTGQARDAIRIVARWLRANGFDAAANRLEQEAGR